MFNTIKSTKTTATRFTATIDTIKFTTKALQIRAEVEGLNKIEKATEDKTQKEAIKEELKHLNVMLNVYKDAAMRSFKSALD